jgi:hypothetical protein
MRSHSADAELGQITDYYRQKRADVAPPASISGVFSAITEQNLKLNLANQTSSSPEKTLKKPLQAL